MKEGETERRKEKGDKHGEREIERNFALVRHAHILA